MALRRRSGSLDVASLGPDQLRRLVRHHVLVLAAGLAALYGMSELAAAVAPLTFEAAGGPKNLVGLAPGVFLASGALAALPAGRAMDRYGRVKVLAGGFAAGTAGSLITALGTFGSSMPAVLIGFVLVGVSLGTVMLSRTAAADMYPPERRAWGISVVLFGAVFGALLGPAIFIPLVSGGGVQSSSLGFAWVGAASFTAGGLLLMTQLRPDPQSLAATVAPDTEAENAPPEALRAIVRRPGVGVALLAAVASWTAMVSLMTMVGTALVDHGHSRGSIFPVLSAHFVGMFGLFLVVGRFIDRFGARRSLVVGVVFLGVSCLGLGGSMASVPLTTLIMFAIGLAWNLAYVAATTVLAGSASAAERGKLLGFADLLSGATGAVVTVLVGFGLTTVGILGVAIAVASLPIVSGALIAVRRAAPAPAG
ncbi:MAG: MFS transporter [Actinomycetota bacterium]|nr:MFS transporter [Actinomycetota bacterium]